MKKIFSNKNKMLTGGLLIVFSSFVSCKKLIEIPHNPPNQITREETFSDSSSAIAAVAGIYTYTPNNNHLGIPYVDGLYDINTAISGHEVSYNGGGDFQQFYNYSLTSSNGQLNSIWLAHYAEIYQVNDVSGQLANNTSLSASLIKQITGEMGVVRAFCYFNLANMFGNVPLVTTTDYTTNAQLPTSTTAVVYNQIVTDLNDAVKKLTGAYPPGFGHVRCNRYTAFALRAKVNLYLHNWRAAFTDADSVIKNGHFILEPNLNNVFLDKSTEAIWQVPVEFYQGTGDAQKYMTDGTPTYPVTDSLLNRFEPGDQRKVDWLATNDGKIYYPFKYKDRNSTYPATDFMLLRYAEMYLIRAEAAARLSTPNFDQAIQDLNTIRNRAGLPSTTLTVASSQVAILAAIRQERRVEMCFELGSRWFDLNRTANEPTSIYPATSQVSDNITTSVLKGWSPNFAIYPIPRAQIILNSHLKQNPGYH